MANPGFAEVVRWVSSATTLSALSDAMLAGKFKDGETIIVDVEETEDELGVKTRQVTLRCGENPADGTEAVILPEPEPEIQAETQGS